MAKGVLRCDKVLKGAVVFNSESWCWYHYGVEVVLRSGANAIGARGVN